MRLELLVHLIPLVLTAVCDVGDNCLLTASGAWENNIKHDVHHILLKTTIPMPPKKQVKATKKPLVQPKRPNPTPKTTKSDWAVNTGIVASGLLLSVAQCASVIGVQHAAQAASFFFNTIENVRSNKEDFLIIADDAAKLIYAIHCQQLKSKNPKKWVSPEIRDMVKELKTALEEVTRIAKRQAERNMIVRILFNLTDAGRIRRTGEMIKTATTKFQILSHINLNELLLEVAAKQQEISEDMKNLTTPPVGEEDEEDEDEDEDEDQFSHLPPTHTNRPGIHGLSISNDSGNMFNSNVGNVANTIISNVGNNNSRNYYD